jgi:hypothetical protein
VSEGLTGIQILEIDFETTRRKEMNGQTIVPTISDNANGFVHAMYIMLLSSSCNSNNIVICLPEPEGNMQSVAISEPY